ncbi:VOC family protein [Pseudoalteromonas xiamenensis]|uniref:VOC family protein n=1 Tax=Pseudoalteromonas xiamenensis TaxID=882626 RepID=A0A975DIQ2_9GAMM|nr:VOC family protein [Pseudoalteromonas xiamenensis]QTH71887.1 VOC family protein [Pseudoalteromonas xiamenensis]
MNLNQVTLPVYDMDSATLFYRKLGLTQIVDTPHYARFVCPQGNSTLSLALREQKENNSGITIYFEHDQLDEWVEELKEKGLPIEVPPEDKRYLWRETFLFDPSGNKIILFYAGENRVNPPWRVTLPPL